MPDLTKFINHISLNFTPFVHLISINEKTKIDHYTDILALEFHSHKKPGKIEISSSKNIPQKEIWFYIFAWCRRAVRASEDPEAALIIQVKETSCCHK